MSLGWDELNRLATVTTSGAGAISQSYQYDPQGRRIRKYSGASVTYYLYNGDDIHAEYSGWGQPDAIHVHGGGTDSQLARLPLVGGVFQPTRYYHTDGLGSVVAATDVSTSGNDVVVNTVAYDPFGAAQSGSLANGYGYTGREGDETGLMYYRARYYDPGMGRFTARDPAGLSGGLNPYAYVGNNPINAVESLRINAELVRWVLMRLTKIVPVEGGFRLNDTSGNDPVSDAPDSDGYDSQEKACNCGRCGRQGVQRPLRLVTGMAITHLQVGRN